MENLVTSHLKMGIIAGGQLAKMLIQEANKWDIITCVLDNDPQCPASRIASFFFQGDNTDFDAVYNFGKDLNILTYEMENINIDALQKLKKEGLRIVPDPDILELIQDKGLQKEFYQNHKIPTAEFRLFPDTESVKKAIDAGELNFPFVQKLRKGGYDGRGVAVIEHENDALLEGPSVIEQKIAIDKEVAVIVARNAKGEVRSFPAVEMVFDKKANLVERLICPSNLSTLLEDEAQSLAKKIIESLNMEGLLAVEFFTDKAGNLIVNEVAPRPHNSGHHTIESVITSQYEQHLRAILNLPLGSTYLKMPAVMINLLGHPDYEGPVKYEGLTESMAIEGVKVHVYGKKETRPMRKMGHATILAETVEEAVKKAEKVKNLIQVKS
ncbi:MAG: 5-(carboxyamino)imidazole ribonucleotide synthase [Bacteroidota bacterium]